MMDSMKHSISTVFMDVGNGDFSQIGIFLILFVIFFVVMMIFKAYVPFFKKAKYFKMEMGRSDGEEYYYWRSQLYKLYRKYIPFAVLFIRKKGSRRRKRHYR